MRKCLLAFLLLVPTLVLAEQKQADDLGIRLQPFVDCLNGTNSRFAIKGEGTIRLKDQDQQIHLEMSRDGEAYSILVDHPTYGARLDRTADMTRLYLPKHNTAIVGKGDVAIEESLSPTGLTARLVSQDSTAFMYLGMLGNKNAAMTAMLLTKLARLNPQGDGTWSTGGEQPATLLFPDEKTLELTAGDSRFRLELCEISDVQSADQAVGTDVPVQEVDRAELERLVVRGVNRGTEILAPSGKLLRPARTDKQVPNGKLTWVDDQRLVTLWGTPEQIGTAHGQLVGAEARKCMDSVLYVVGLARLIDKGKWPFTDLRNAWTRLEKFIPDDHKAEMIALAGSMGATREELELGNVFPELFHCSGFAVWGSATVGGKLYHGRVLDYMTMVGLQDSATTFIVLPDGKNAFANVGYAGFIGSVTGMNDQQISLGEMGGRGEGNWDGVPMATLMRRALEECSTLDEVRALWTNSPRTCEYYYVFADGKIPSAVGVGATPEKIFFVEPGAAHEMLGEGIKDAVVLSAGDRLACLRDRVTDNYGTFDAERGMWLMSRPVSMKSNLHNVLFVPQDGDFYVANADHEKPAAERHFVKYNLKELIEAAREVDKVTR
jgi:hypothetical protein